LGCDHGVTFHQDDKLRTVLWQWANTSLDPQEIEQLQRLHRVIAEDSAFLAELITETEIASLLMRIGRLINDGEFPAPSDEWPAVPWPPF
jgi:uncharacterized repeat protein (TIGR03843 family)